MVYLLKVDAFHLCSSFMWEQLEDVFLTFLPSLALTPAPFLGSPLTDGPAYDLVTGDLKHN